MPLRNLPRVWLGQPLPGYREGATPFATYTGYQLDQLPAVDLSGNDEFAWLLAEPVVKGHASLAVVDASATRPATQGNLELLMADTGVVLPASFSAFINSEDPRKRVRSCTDCYLDLADFAVPVSDGGYLIHFLSDSQWVAHWLLYVGPDQAEAVVATWDPLGFNTVQDEPPVRLFVPGTSDAWVCADSFSEFLFRFWIENEVWFKLVHPSDELPLSDQQRRYLKRLGPLRQPTNPTSSDGPD